MTRKILQQRKLTRAREALFALLAMLLGGCGALVILELVLNFLPVNTAGPVHAGGRVQEITHGSFLDADSRLAWAP